MSRVLQAVSRSGGDSAESHIGGLRANYLTIFAFNGDIYSADSFLARKGMGTYTWPNGRFYEG